MLLVISNLVSDKSLVFVFNNLCALEEFLQREVSCIRAYIYMVNLTCVLLRMQSGDSEVIMYGFPVSSQCILRNMELSKHCYAYIIISYACVCVCVHVCTVEGAAEKARRIVPHTQDISNCVSERVSMIHKLTTPKQVIHNFTHTCGCLL